MTRLISIITVLLLGSVLNVSAEGKILRWESPGADPYQLGVEDLAKVLTPCYPIPKGIMDQLTGELSKRTVTKARTIAFLESSQISEPQKGQLVAKIRAEKRSFFAPQQLDELLPGDVAREISEKEIAKRDEPVVELKSGERCTCMPFGAGKMQPDVVYAPKDGKPLKGYLLAAIDNGVQFTFFHPFKCNNVCVRVVDMRLVRTHQPSEALTAKAAATELQVVGPPEGGHVEWTHLLSRELSTVKGREVLDQLKSGHGLQSRDVYKEIREGLRTGDIKHATGDCLAFHIDYHDVNLETARGAEVWTTVVDRGKPVLVRSTFATQGVGVSFLVCAGEGKVIIPVKPAWATTKLSATVSAATELRGKLSYPASYALRTCGPATVGRCGSNRYNDPSDHWRRLQSVNTTDYYFVLE